MRPDWAQQQPENTPVYLPEGWYPLVVRQPHSHFTRWK
jgi:hypothetical protein